MPKIRAAMHLDTVFTFADRDCVLLAPDFLAKTTAFSYRPSSHPSGVGSSPRRSRSSTSVAQALGFRSCASSRPAAATTSASARSGTAARTWCASPGVVYAYDRNTYTNTLLAQGGHRGHHASSAPNWAAGRGGDTA